jgi:hypothetical protein
LPRPDFATEHCSSHKTKQIHEYELPKNQRINPSMSNEASPHRRPVRAISAARAPPKYPAATAFECVVDEAW